ncbi:MAG: RDD family protein [Gammaproteobacteria bacterium]|nr:RDD family protein [Gammaproteobacteria bacterium]
MSGNAQTPASFGQRIGAGAIDLSVLLLAALLLTWIAIEIQGAELKSRSELSQAVVELWRGLLLVPTLVLALAAMTLGWTLFKATPGQLLMGCRVLRRKRTNSLNPYLSLWRAVATLLLAAPTGVPLLLMFLDPGRRAAHDWLSDSIVVEEDESRVPVDQWLSELG